MSEKDIIEYKIRIDKTLFNKFKIIAKEENRSINGAIGRLIRLRVREFEMEYGKIEL